MKDQSFTFLRNRRRSTGSLLREEFGVLCAVIHVWGMVFNLVPPDMWGPDKKLGHGGEPTTSVVLHLHP
jgi:hypothetical protein